MAIKIIEELKEELASLPNQYKIALEKQTQQILETERLEREIVKLKKTLSSENDTDDNEWIDGETILLDLETNLEKLKLKLSHTEYSVELNSRKTGEKVTESTVKALVGTDEQIYKLREQLIDEQANLKTKKSELNRQRQERKEKERISHRQKRSTPESQELDDLENQLSIVRNDLLSANDEVEELKFRLETYKLLVSLESLEEAE